MSQRSTPRPQTGQSTRRRNLLSLWSSSSRERHRAPLPTHLLVVAQHWSQHGILAVELLAWNLKKSTARSLPIGLAKGHSTSHNPTHFVAGVSTRWPPHLLRRPYGPRKIQPTDCSRHRRRHHIRGRQKIHRNAQRNARRHARSRLRRHEP